MTRASLDRASQEESKAIVEEAKKLLDDVESIRGSLAGSPGELGDVWAEVIKLCTDAKKKSHGLGQSETDALINELSKFSDKE